MFIKFRMSATLAVSLSLVSTGLSAAQETRQPIDIPAQSLIAAIGELGVETGFQVSADNTLVADKRSSAVSGRMTPGEALMRMLAGTNLSFRSLGADGAVITVAQTPNADERPLVMDEIIVEGEKVFRTLREVPASTVVIPGDVAEAPQNQTVNDVIQGIPNVFAPESFNLPAIRGIDGSAGQIGGAALTTGAQPRVPIIVDGVPRPLTIGSTPSVNTPWDIKAVEVARGPQGTTTGRNA
ncbi:MAG: TonB-dependent receptor plug domain-containing protein, partial [Pseudomonadota bacterium]